MKINLDMPHYKHLFAELTKLREMRDAIKDDKSEQADIMRAGIEQKIHDAIYAIGMCVENDVLFAKLAESDAR